MPQALCFDYLSALNHGHTAMKWVISSWILLIACTVRGQAGTDSLLNELTGAIEKAPVYDAEKLKKIGGLQSRLYADTVRDPTALYQLYKDLYDEYRIFHYDSAYRYAGKMQDIAYRVGD